MAETEGVQVNGNSTKVENKKEHVEITDNEMKIIEQIEFYFGDCNLPRDKFLQQEIKKDDGWVLLNTMLTFKRLAKLSNDPKVIVSALRKSESGLIEISEDSSKVRRCPSHVLPEMNEARRQELVNRSLYVKGFPSENTQMDTLLEFFRKYTKVDQLIMRKYLDKATKSWIFKGSVFAVFTSVEEAEKFLNQAPFKYEETDLIVKWQKDYIVEKRNSRLQIKLDGQKQKRKNKEEDDDEDENEEEEKKDELPKGAALYLTDCSEDLTREGLKAKIESAGIAVAFLYFNKGDKEGWIRLQEPNSASEVVKILVDGKLVLNDDLSVSVRALEGEEEDKFLERAKEDMLKRKSRNKGGFRARRGRKGGRGGFGGGHFRKRKGSPNAREEGKSKKVAVDTE